MAVGNSRLVRWSGREPELGVAHAFSGWICYSGVTVTLVPLADVLGRLGGSKWQSLAVFDGIRIAVVLMKPWVFVSASCGDRFWSSLVDAGGGGFA